MIGHLIGAAGAVELIATVLAMQNALIPATINYRTKDPECDLDYVPNEPRKTTRLNIAMSNSFGFGSNNAAIIVKNIRG
jgi:3-oxoacyl-[acyl-carrier-protein] synthase II